MPITIRDDGVVIEGNAVDVDFLGGISVTLIAAGTVQVQIPLLGITTAMLADGSITLAKLASGSIDSSKVVDGSLTAVKFDATTLTEFVQDVLGVTFVNSGSITAAYNDGAGTLTLTVNFAGSGAAATAARSDHSHTATVTLRTVSNPSCANGTFCSGTPTCIAGEQIVGGGAELGHAAMVLTGSRPTGNAWFGIAFNNTGATQSLVVYALCQETPIL